MLWSALRGKTVCSFQNVKRCLCILYTGRLPRCCVKILTLHLWWTLSMFCSSKPYGKCFFFFFCNIFATNFMIQEQRCKSPGVDLAAWHGVGGVTRLRVRSWPRLSRWKRRNVTFCGTWWPQGLSSGWGADKCQSGGTWGTSPFSSGCRLATGPLRSSSW